MKNEEEVLSLQSPMVFWAELLARYAQDKPKKRGKIYKFANKVGHLLLRIGRKSAKPLAYVYHAVLDRVQWVYTCLNGYIRINVLKKY